MSVFTQAELQYLREQPLGRLATVGPEGQPHVVPVSYDYLSEPDAIGIGGWSFGDSKKYRDAKRNPRVAMVVDDVLSREPMRTRCIEIRGEATTFASGGDRLGPDQDDAWMRIDPTRIVSWGLDGDAPRAVNSRSV